MKLDVKAIDVSNDPCPSVIAHRPISFRPIQKVHCPRFDIDVVHHHANCSFTIASQFFPDTTEITLLL